MTWKRIAVIAIPAIALTLSVSGGAHAGNLVTNGGFETTTHGNGQLGYNTDATGWTSTNANDNAYNFLFASGTADVGGATGQNGKVKLWGPHDGSNNGLPASSPDGGNFVAADGAYHQGAISQTIHGLTAGDTYTVGFYWAGAQQAGFKGPTTEQWQVSFGGQTQSTDVVRNGSHGFTGWVYQTFNFRADSASDVLSFFAVGTPHGEPPFVLLDGVSVNSVPEPAALSLMVVALLGLGAVGLRRRARSAAV